AWQGWTASYDGARRRFTQEVNHGSDLGHGQVEVVDGLYAAGGQFGVREVHVRTGDVHAPLDAVGNSAHTVRVLRRNDAEEGRTTTDQDIPLPSLSGCLGQCAVGGAVFKAEASGAAVKRDGAQFDGRSHRIDRGWRNSAAVNADLAARQQLAERA